MRVALALIAAIVVGVGCAAANVDHWLFEVLDPGAFDPSATPPAPDYSKVTSWAALPELEDGADVFLPELPALGRDRAPADVFYVHPTTWVGTKWNGPIDDPAVIAGTERGGTLIQASAFNACCAVYAPRYRQANGKAYVTVTPDARTLRAIDVAYRDVARAFHSFQQRRGAGRPFILASHSQGTVLAARLLREEIWGSALRHQLVVAYLVGGPVSLATLGGDIPVCASPVQTGCVAAWNARGPNSVPNPLEFAAPAGGDLRDPLVGRICVNPLSWRIDQPDASADANPGALFFDAETPAILPGFADGSCQNGRLLVRRMGRPPRDFMSKVLDWMMGPENYHPIEYQLYYVSLRQNAVDRVRSFRFLE